MTQDNAMDVSPSWQELKDERDALAAHVEVLQEKQIAETCACSHDTATDVCLGHSPMLENVKAERDVLAAKVDALTGAVLRPFVATCTDAEAMEEARRIAMEAPATSLARLKAQWQAEALERVAAEAEKQERPWSAHWLTGHAKKIRRQAEGDES